MEIHSSITSSEELMHYGRKGMKWYQNIFTKDKVGSGKKGKSDKDDDDDSKSKGSSSSSSSGGKKSAKDMSETELMSAIRHLQLEKQYRDLEAQQAAELNPPKVSKGKEFISDFVKKSAVPALQEAGKSVLKDWLVKVGKEAMGLNETKVESAYDKLQKEVNMLELQKKKTLVEDFYKNRDEKAQRDAEKAAKKADAAKRKEEAEKKQSDTAKRKEEEAKAEAEAKKAAEAAKDPRDSFNYYFDGAGKSKTDSGAEHVKAAVTPDTRISSTYTVTAGKSYVDDVLAAAAAKYEEEKPWYK